MATAKKSVRSNSKEIIDANRKTILSEYSDAPRYEGISREQAFARDVEDMMDMQNRNGYRSSPYSAVAELVNGASLGNPYTYERAKYLNSVGLKKYDADKDDIDDYSEPVNDLYTHILARDGANLYRQIKEGKYNPKAKAKPKTPARKAPSKKASTSRKR